MDYDLERDASPRSIDRTMKTRGGSGRFSRVLTPTVKEWFRTFALDWVTIITLGALAFIGDKFAPPVGGGARYFRLQPSGTDQLGTIDHPYRKQIISFWLSAGLDVAIPVVTIVFLQFFRGSFYEATRATLGVINSIIICCFFQIIMKILIGGFRPNFLEVCKPDLSLGEGKGFDGTYYTAEICTNTDELTLSWSQESFPSGHVATAFAAATFLSLYINARLKVFADYRANVLMIVFNLYPLLLAMLMAGAISIDMSHHWYDIVAGGILGTGIAFLCYKNTYVAWFNPRLNHVPLPNARRLGRERLDMIEERAYTVHLGFPTFPKQD